MTSRTRTLLILGFILLLAAFLAGFVPQYRRAGQMESELAAQRERARTLESNARIATALRLASAMFLESSRLNYGNASQRATEFFSHVRALIADTSDPKIRQPLEQIAARRDTVVATLARGDAAAQPQIQEIMQKVLEIAGARSE